MGILDEKGRIFGVVNIIDAFVVFLVVAAAGMGAAILFGVGGETSVETTEPVTVTVRAENVAPFVADAIEEGPVNSDDIVGIKNVSTSPAMVVTNTENGTLREVRHPRNRAVRMDVTVNATGSAGEYVFQNGELEIGRQIELDLGNLSVIGRVTGM